MHAFSRRTRTKLLIVLMLFSVLPLPLSATWSIIAVDAKTGRVVIASATCVPQGRFAGFPAEGLMDVQAIVVPGVGIAAAQAGVDNTRANQNLIYSELKNGVSPSDVLTQLQTDPLIERRQFGILDLEGRMAGFSGSGNGAASLSVQGRLPNDEIFFSVQGNILASDDVVYEAVHRFLTADGSLTDRVMAAMEGADELGGDVRCTCETEPIPDASCDSKNAHVAYILAADPGDAVGTSFNDGQYAMYISVTDEDIQPDENANPVITLRQRYDAWMARTGG